MARLLSQPCGKWYEVLNPIIDSVSLTSARLTPKQAVAGPPLQTAEGSLRSRWCGEQFR